MPAKSFYGAIDPTLALKVLKGAPTLKGAFTAGVQESTPPLTQPNKKEKKKGQSCTGYFGCKNLAQYQEASGTLYCKEHRPKQVQTLIITSDKPAARRVQRK